VATRFRGNKGFCGIAKASIFEGQAGKRLSPSKKLEMEEY